MGHYLFGYRHYNTGLKRFTQTDPTMQEANPYAYSGDDPINNSDPTGAAFWDEATTDFTASLLTGTGALIVGLAFPGAAVAVGAFLVTTAVATATYTEDSH